MGVSCSEFQVDDVVVLRKDHDNPEESGKVIEVNTPNEIVTVQLFDKYITEPSDDGLREVHIDDVELIRGHDDVITAWNNLDPALKDKIDLAQVMKEFEKQKSAGITYGNMTRVGWLLGMMNYHFGVGPDHARREYVQGLHDVELMYHFDDDPFDCLSKVASQVEIAMIEYLTGVHYCEDMFIQGNQLLENEENYE